MLLFPFESLKVNNPTKKKKKQKEKDDHGKGFLKEGFFIPAAIFLYKIACSESSNADFADTLFAFLQTSFSV